MVTTSRVYQTGYQVVTFLETYPEVTIHILLAQSYV